MKYPINWNSPRSVHNWVETLGLDCVEPYRIGLMGSMFFLGIAVFTLFVARSADIYGRKYPVRISSLLSLPTQFGLLFSNNLTLSTVIFFFQGACSPGKVQVSFVYVCELVPVRFRTYIGSLVLFGMGTTMILFAVYFRFISK